MGQIKKEKWLKTGLYILDQHGAEQLKISNLCRQLKVTKGAFYHWFNSKSDFDSALLEYWKNEFTEQFIDGSELGTSAKEKLSLLVRQCINGVQIGSRLEIEINMWSKQDEFVAKYVVQVYQQRFDYLMMLLNDIYDCRCEAKRHGLILYCLFIGCDLFFKNISIEDAELMFRDYLID